MASNAELAQRVQRAIARDPDAVRWLVETVGPVVHEHVAKALRRRRLAASADWDDPSGELAREVDRLSEEVFLALYDNGARALRAWSAEHTTLDRFVALVTEYQVASILRGGVRRPWSDEIDIVADPLGTRPLAWAGSGDGAARAVSKQTLDALLDRLHADLTPRGFDLFARLYVEQQPVDVVAADLGMSADAVRAWRGRLGGVLRGLAASVEARAHV